MRPIDADFMKRNIKTEPGHFSDLPKLLREWIDKQPTIEVIPLEAVAHLLSKKLAVPCEEIMGYACEDDDFGHCMQWEPDREKCWMRYLRNMQEKIEK